MRVLLQDYWFFLIDPTLSHTFFLAKNKGFGWFSDFGSINSKSTNRCILWRMRFFFHDCCLSNDDPPRLPCIFLMPTLKNHNCLADFGLISLFLG